MLDQCAAEGMARSDIRSSELAGYCLHALGAAAKAPDEAAVRRIVDLTWRSLVAPAATNESRLN